MAGARSAAGSPPRSSARCPCSPRPDRPSDVPVDAARLRRRPAADARRPALRAEPRRHARYLPAVLGRRRLRLPRGRPRRRTARGSPTRGSPSPAGAGPGRGSASAGGGWPRACASAPRCGTKWSGLSISSRCCCSPSRGRRGSVVTAAVHAPLRAALLAGGRAVPDPCCSSALPASSTSRPWSGWFVTDERLAAGPGDGYSDPGGGRPGPRLRRLPPGDPAGSTPRCRPGTRTSPTRGLAAPRPAVSYYYATPRAAVPTRARRRCSASARARRLVGVDPRPRLPGLGAGSPAATGGPRPSWSR